MLKPTKVLKTMYGNMLKVMSPVPVIKCIQSTVHIALRLFNTLEQPISFLMQLGQLKAGLAWRRDSRQQKNQGYVDLQWYKGSCLATSIRSVHGFLP